MRLDVANYDVAVRRKPSYCVFPKNFRKRIKRYYIRQQAKRVDRQGYSWYKCSESGVQFCVTYYTL